MKLLLTLVALARLSIVTLAAPFEIAEGDRVLLLGDALLERENTTGYLETRMQQQFPKVKFSVRNLSWSGETPKGWARASFDPPAKGWERLKEEIAEVKPTVAVLGFGMAASLQEMTDRSGDTMLNGDPVRYGAEPMTAVRFKKELGELMDAIKASGTTRFILLSPIQHEDLRGTRPGLPDPAPHNALLAQYTKVIEELAKERGATFVNLFPVLGGLQVPRKTELPRTGYQTDNGIHLSTASGPEFARTVAEGLGWKDDGRTLFTPQAEQVRTAVLQKNDLFFHQFRPANSTYLFGFRKHEQGKNAAEMPKFTPLIEATDAEIDTIKRASSKARSTAPTDDSKAVADVKPLPPPTFTLTDGMELTLWADTPMVGKPVGMNWDAAGRLWVACSPVYPMIAPGAHPDDKVVVLEDTDHDGKADKSTTFATDLLIAQGVAPDFGREGAPSPSPSSKPGNPAPQLSAAYVGASTELVRLEDTNGDGKADVRRVVLSGFGTEDTHHTIHTLRWGPDGRLYFDQSIYIHSHLETPWGMVRLNSGGIMAYDPRTERVEVTAKGWCNPWGHAWDQWGQEFVTDGAGFQGISWLVPGAMYFTYENGRKIMPSVSPGSYPKYCGLELIQSPLFPKDWQGDAITCDFRAHRVVRFKFNDLADAPEPKSGYVTKEMPAPITTTDAAFRPNDVKLGPDGALYFSDWTNPIINHGEVDFRDPRRDHVHGRIWRLAPKGSTPLKWESLVGKSAPELLALVASRYAEATHPVQLPNGEKSTQPTANVWAAESARRVLLASPQVLQKEIQSLLQTGVGSSPSIMTAAGEFNLALGPSVPPNPGTLDPATMANTVTRMEANVRPQGVAQTVRRTGETFLRVLQGASTEAVRKSAQQNALTFLGAFAKAKSPRVRVEAMRALARIPTAESAALVLEAAINAPGGKGGGAALPGAPKQQFDNAAASETGDSHYAYAAWLSVNDLAPQVMEWIEKSGDATQGAALTPAKRDAMIAYALQSLRSEQTSVLISKIVAKNGVAKDGSGPWIELIGQAGGPAECQILLNALLAATTPDSDQPHPLADAKYLFANPEANRRAAAALVVAARRGVVPPDHAHGWQFFYHAPKEAAADVVRLAGLWKEKGVANAVAAHLDASDSAPMRDAIFESLRTMGSDESAQMLGAFLAPKPEKESDVAFVRIALRKNNPEIRRRALGALAAFRPDAALAALSGVLRETDAPAALPLWRELLASEKFGAALLAHVPPLTPEQAAPALRAAREMGKKGEKLSAALSPLAGAAAASANPADFAWLADFTKKNGNAAEGELVYRRLALACTVCHSIGGAGGKVGPDLTTIGASAPLDYLVESVMVPAAKVKEGFNAVALTLKGGRAASGIQLRETDREIILRDATGGEQAVPKAEITAKDNIGSLMPPGLTATLTDREKADLFAFLSQLGKPGPFDATKGTVARVWEIIPGKDIEKVVSAGVKADKAAARSLTLVDGRLPKAQLTESLQLAPDAGDTILVLTRFSSASASKSRVNLQGATKAYLDGAPLAIASEPNPVIDLAAGPHVLAIKLDVKTLPDVIRAECADVRFLNE